MKDIERRRILNRVEVIAGQTNTHLAKIIGAVTDAMAGQPQAHAFWEGAIGNHQVVWCWDHGCEVRACHKADRDCDGEPIPLNDPTGEAAIEHDPARCDLEGFDRSLERWANDAERILDFARRWKPPTSDQADGIREAFSKLIDSGEPGCEMCARAGRWSPPHVETSDCKGNLPRPYRLCVWCYRFVLSSGRLPTPNEVEAHLAGRRLRRPA